MTHIAFTSIAATNRIADQVMRTIGRDTSEPIKRVTKFVHPMGWKLEERGKLTRTELGPIFKSIVAGLRCTENVIDVEVAQLSTGKLSANDGYHIRFSLACGDGEWMYLVACSLTLTRHNATILVNNTGFDVTPHLLARYMQRCRKSFAEFLATVSRPLRLSTLLAYSQAESGLSKIALPIDGGLMIGTLYRVEDGAFPPIKVVFDKHGPHDEEAEVSAPEVAIHMRTFLDRDALNPRQQGILDGIEAWEAAHRRGIAASFEALTFGGARLDADYDFERLQADVTAAVEGCLDLVGSPEWRHLDPS